MGAPIAELRKEVDSWMGTPYFHMGRQKGVCVDCGGLVLLSLRNAGVITEAQENRYYSKNWFRNTGNEFLLNIILEHFDKFYNGYKIEQIPTDSYLRDYDILLFNHPAIAPACHASFYIAPGKIVHCFEGLKVKYAQYSMWKARLKYVLRIQKSL